MSTDLFLKYIVVLGPLYGLSKYLGRFSKDIVCFRPLFACLATLSTCVFITSATTLGVCFELLVNNFKMFNS